MAPIRVPMTSARTATTLLARTSDRVTRRSSGFPSPTLIGAAGFSPLRAEMTLNMISLIASAPMLSAVRCRPS